MASFITWIGDVLTVPVVHWGAVAPGGVDITPGLMVAGAIISVYAFRFAKRLKGFG